MDQIRIAADSSCDLLTMDGVDFVSVPLTVRTAVEEFRDDAALNVDAMVTTLRGTKGRTFSACPNIADWESAFGESGDVLAFTITSSLSGSCSAALAAKKRCEEQNPSRRIFVVDTLSAGPEIALLIEKSAAELRSARASRRSAQPYSSISAVPICSLRWNPCTISPRTDESASWRQRWPVFSASAPLGRPARRARLRCSANVGALEKRRSSC